MGTYDKNIDYSIVMDNIRASFVYYCIELQLVWLTELLILHYYTLSKNEIQRHIRQHKIYDIFTPSDVTEKLKAEGELHRIYSKLVAFRNTYVHAGSQTAYDTFRDLYNNHKLELIELARIVDVNLNFNCVLYRILEKRVL